MIKAISSNGAQLAKAKRNIPDAVIIVLNKLIIDRMKDSEFIEVVEKDFVDAMRKFVGSSECAPGYLISPEYADRVLREDFGISSIYPDIKTIFEIEGEWASVSKPTGWAPCLVFRK